MRRIGQTRNTAVEYSRPGGTEFAVDRVDDILDVRSSVVAICDSVFAVSPMPKLVRQTVVRGVAVRHDSMLLEDLSFFGTWCGSLSSTTPCQSVLSMPLGCGKAESEEKSGRGTLTCCHC